MISPIFKSQLRLNTMLKLNYQLSFGSKSVHSDLILLCCISTGWFQPLGGERNVLARSTIGYP